MVSELLSIEAASDADLLKLFHDASTGVRHGLPVTGCVRESFAAVAAEAMRIMLHMLLSEKLQVERILSPNEILLPTC